MSSIQPALLSRRSSKTIKISFGITAEPLHKQIGVQGYKYDADQVRVFQDHCVSIIKLFFAKIITASAMKKAEYALWKQIIKHVRDENKA